MIIVAAGLTVYFKTGQNRPSDVENVFTEIKHAGQCTVV